MEYFIFNVFCSLFSFANVMNARESKERLTSYFILSSIIVLTIGLRGIMDEYTKLFVRVPELSQLLSFQNTILWDKGYTFAIVSGAIHTFGGNSQTLLIIFAFASVFIHIIIYRKLTKYYFVALLLYLSHEIIFKDWIAIRMGLASAMVLLCAYCVEHNKKGWFFFWFIIGAGIHYVGILSIFIILLRKKRNSITLFLFLIICILISQTGLIKEMMLYTGNIILDPSHQIYIYMQMDETYGYNLGLSHPKILQQLVVLLIVLYFQRNKTLHQIPYFTLIINIYFLSTICFILFSEIAIFSTRFGGHFNSVEPILIILIAYKFIQKKYYLNMICLTALALSYTNYIYRDKLPEYDLFTIDVDRLNDAQLIDMRLDYLIQH